MLSFINRSVVDVWDFLFCEVVKLRIYKDELSIKLEMRATIDKVRSTLRNDNNCNELNNVWKKLKCKNWHNDLRRFFQWWLRPPWCVVSCLYYFNGVKTLLQIKYYNWVRDKTKSNVFGLRVVFDDILDEYESSLFIVLSTYNDNCSLDTCLMLNNEWVEVAPRTWRDKNSILGASEKPLDQNRELAQSSGLQAASGYILFVRSIHPRVRSVEQAGRANFSILSVSFCSSKASSKILCTSSLNTTKTNNSHDYFNK